MTTIQLLTNINAPTEVVFDLSRSVDLHIESTRQTGEKAVAGKTTGLMELGECVTWRAKHFGITQNLTSRITEMDRPNFFVDEMEKGIFKSFKHTHRFKPIATGTLMEDVFEYKSPLGFLGKLADVIFLKNYMQRLLEIRNETIRVHAEAISVKVSNAE